jgi:hypothetical protein
MAEAAILILDRPVLAPIPSTMNPTGTVVIFVLFEGPKVNVVVCSSFYVVVVAVEDNTCSYYYV